MNDSISIIICTRNRAESLRRTLEAINAVNVPENATAELLVIDNGSRDDTAAVVEAAQLAAIPVRRVFEPTPGLSHARNRGLAESRGEVIVFTDDDVRPEAHWLERLTEPLLADEADVVAGGVRVAEAVQRPWFEQRHRIDLASTEHLAAGDTKRGKAMVGANMAFHRRVLAAVPRFDPELGAGALGFGEESLFWRQLVEAGFRATARLDAEIEHHPDPARLDRASFLRSAWHKGRAKAYIEYHWKHKDIDRPRRTLLRAAVRMMRQRWRAYRGRTPEAVPEWEMRLVRELGYHWHYLTERRRPRNYHRRGLRRIDAADDTMPAATHPPRGEAGERHGLAGGVSVIIPVYNAERYVAEAVESALIQPETREVLLIDDGSTDHSLTICRELAGKDQRVRVLQHPGGENRGVSASRNLGIERASCEFVAFLDADDVFLPDRFKAAAEVFAQYPDTDGVYDAVGVMFEDEAAEARWSSMGRTGTLTTIRQRLEPTELFEALMTGRSGRWCMCGIVLRKALLTRTGGFDPRFRIGEDVHLWARVAALGVLRAGRIEEGVALRRVHGQNTYAGTPASQTNDHRLPIREDLICWGRRNGLPLEKMQVLATRWYRLWRKAHVPARGVGRLRASVMGLTKLAWLWPGVVEVPWYRTQWRACIGEVFGGGPADVALSSIPGRR